MSIMSDFEDRLSRAVEGLFAGAFRSPVQPAELAKALARAMDDGRSVGVGKVYAPTRYVIGLSAEDREQLGDFATTLAGELATYLVGHAGEQGYDLLARPAISFEVHDDLKLGRFRVAATMTASGSPDAGAAAPPEAAPIPAMPYAAPAVPRVPAVHPVHALATVTVSETQHDIALKGDHLDIGRLNDCAIALTDANVSRRHAALVLNPDGWTITDLGSTNGTYVNGERVTQRRLYDGDTIEVGATQLVFHEPKG